MLACWLWSVGASAQIDASVPLDAGVPIDAGDAGPVLDITVRAKGPSADQKRRSAEAITVVDMARAQQQSADLGEVLARTEGVAIRRTGGLGSDAQLSLNGLWGSQIRSFIDGVPSGLLYPFDIASVPVQLVKQVEIFRGVVPVRFGADALGGAINLVPVERSEASGEVSLQAGSFGTFRGLLSAGQQLTRSGLYVDASAFLDRARNDFVMSALAPDAQNRPQPVRVRRFHDRYAAEGGSLELGVRDRPWAKRLSVRGFSSASRRDIQHDLLVVQPDGESELKARSGGALGRYDVALGRGLELETVAVYAHTRTERTDPDRFLYDWFGRRVGQVRVPRPVDNLYLQQDGYARATLSFQLAPKHALKLVTTPAVTFYTGKNRSLTAGALDALSADQRLTTWISGAEYQADLASDRLQNIAFVKAYSYRVDSEEPLPGDIVQDFSLRRRSAGFGDGARYLFTRWLYAKVSYEYATRLPTAGEVFGDGLFVRRNLELKPERSHNLNVGPTLDLRRTAIGDLRVDVSGFARFTRDQVVAIPVDNISYSNIANARTLGVDTGLHWTSVGRYVAVDASNSYVHSVNTSSQGTFARFEGDRVPNRPWLLSSWMANGRYEYGDHARIEPFYYGRYVHAYYLGWESIGQGGNAKRSVPAQTTHNLGVSHILDWPTLKVTTTCEVQNLSNAIVYDQFRVPRPGRGFYFKLSASL